MCRTACSSCCSCSFDPSTSNEDCGRCRGGGSCKSCGCQPLANCSRSCCGVCGSGSCDGSASKTNCTGCRGGGSCHSCDSDPAAGSSLLSCTNWNSGLIKSGAAATHPATDDSRGCTVNPRDCSIASRGGCCGCGNSKLSGFSLLANESWHCSTSCEMSTSESGCGACCGSSACNESSWHLLTASSCSLTSSSCTCWCSEWCCTCSSACWSIGFSSDSSARWQISSDGLAGCTCSCNTCDSNDASVCVSSGTACVSSGTALGLTRHLSASGVASGVTSTATCVAPGRTSASACGTLTRS
mmetsp:Transcript_47095/g.82896  ORF Transcript_47095/g.82896 Transcript_47095/m.82896 type:complete len:299 (+) Transcript_47095:1236-2132(+)